jgi:hypothetical protein
MATCRRWHGGASSPGAVWWKREARPSRPRHDSCQPAHGKARASAVYMRRNAIPQMVGKTSEWVAWTAIAAHNAVDPG